jgi:carboxypeptidase Q
MRRSLIALVVVAACGSRATAADPALSPEVRRTAAGLADAGFAGTRATDWVRSLTDRVGPRPAGSDGDRAAVAWALATMKSLGFSNVHAEKVIVPVWKRGLETGEIVAPYRQPLALTALGGSVPTPASGLEAEILAVGSIDDLEAKGDAARGRIVFFNKKMERAIDGSGYGRAVDVRTDGATAAAKQGAAGVLIRSIGTDHNRTPHTGGVTYGGDASKIPAAALSIPDAEMLERIVAEGHPVRVRFALGCSAEPDAESANVVGEIPGRGKPGEIVLLGAHLDSWDLGTGAIDDGAGCGIVLEAARAIGALPRRPARTIRVVLYANEEHGISGGKAYREAHRAELARHVAAFEADNGSGGPLGLSWLAGGSAEPVLRDLVEVLAPLGVAELAAGGSGGADISPLRADGVPQFSFRQDASRYFDWHHTSNDTFDKVEPASMDRMAAALAALAWVAASTDTPFERIPEGKRTEESLRRKK